MLPKNMKKDSVVAYAYMRRGTLLLLYTTVHILDDSPSPHQLHTYWIDGSFLNQKRIKTFEYRIH